MTIEADSDRHPDMALLLLRCSGLFLALTFGQQKALALWHYLLSGQPLAAWDMTQFLRQFHFPAPALFAVLATLNESLVTLLITAGFYTRLAAMVATSGMIVAFCVSMKLGEEPLRALLYVFIFACVAIAGPGRFSIDYLLKRRGESRMRTAR